MFYTWCYKLVNFGIGRHHGAKCVNHLFVKLTIECKPCLNVSYIQKSHQSDIFDIPNELF
jgi:hypothetical protein